MKRYQVNLVVEAFVNADGPGDAAAIAEGFIQRVLDRYAKRLKAVVGADYADVQESPK